MRISVREVESITILDLDGELTVGEGVTAVRAKVQELIEAGKTKVLINLNNVDYMDSTGLGSLVICYTGLQRAGGALKLLNLNRRNVELLLLTKLVSVFEIFNEEREAVNSFFPDRKIEKFDILAFVQEERQREEE